MPPKITSRQLAFDAGPVPPFLQQLHAQVNGGKKAKLGDKFDSSSNETFPDDVDHLAQQAYPSRGTSKTFAHRDSHASLSKQQNGNQDDDDEDELSGAQVVVLRDGKHLSAREVEAIRQQQSRDARSKGDTDGATMPATSTSERPNEKPRALAAAGISTLTRKRRGIEADSKPAEETGPGKRKADDLDSVKRIIAGKRGAQTHDSHGAARDPGHQASASLEEQQGQAQGGKARKLARQEEKNRVARAEKKRAGKGLSFSFEDE